MPHPLLRFLHAARPDGVADAELLRRFVAARDEAAFEVLVRRHADTVWRACRGVLRREADAEDVFQATFLTLAVRAADVRETGTVGGWLHRVAVNAALKARKRTGPAVELTDVPAPEAADPELAAVVHEELARLSEAYRLPVVLCDLEGHTHAEAARLLGWPVGTVSGRLSRARDRLRERLARRGLAGVVVVALAAHGSARSELVRTAVGVGTGAVPPAVGVATLTAGVVTAMRVARLKLVAVVVVAALAASGSFVAWGHGQAPPPKVGPEINGLRYVVTLESLDTKPGDAPPTAFPELGLAGEKLEVRCPRLLGAKEIPDAAADTPLGKLQKARLREVVRMARLNFNGVFTGWGADGPAIQRLSDVLARLPSAVADVEAAADARAAWAEERVLLSKAVERMVAERTGPGPLTRDDLPLARVLRVEAEIELLKLKRR